jgi:hypothetical protein
LFELNKKSVFPNFGLLFFLYLFLLPAFKINALIFFHLQEKKLSKKNWLKKLTWKTDLKNWLEKLTWKTDLKNWLEKLSVFLGKFFKSVFSSLSAKLRAANGPEWSFFKINALILNHSGPFAVFKITTVILKQGDGKEQSGEQFFCLKESKSKAFFFPLDEKIVIRGEKEELKSFF